MKEPVVLVTREHALACATNVGRRLGYAIGVHGSRIKDLDLIAAPWNQECRVIVFQHPSERYGRTG